MSDSGFPCPSCDRVLNTEGGKRQHHSKIHDEPLPNCTCKGCGSEFYHPKSNRKFCEACDPRKGENNSNYKDAKEETTCNECGEDFEYYPSDKEGLYCSECQREQVNQNNLWKYDSEDILGEDNPRWSGGLHEIDCHNCGSTTKRRAHELEKYTRLFCSNKCRLEWYSSNWDNFDSSWSPKQNMEYSSEMWFIVRNNVLKRDDNTCQICGDKHRFNHVHHMIPKRLFENEEDAHYEDNCITLCISCHGCVEKGSMDIPESVIEGKGLEDPPYEKYANR